MGKVKDFRMRHKQLIRYVITGLLITVILVAAKIAFEHSSVGHRLEIFTYEFLQGQLTSIDKDPLPVLVVDIGQMPGGKSGEVTPRDQLQNLIEAIVNQQPKAIAIDVDFSPNRAGWLTEDDPDFFDFCLRMKKVRGVPVFLGVHRTMASSPETWLGLEEYKELAVVLLAHKDTTRLPVWVQRTKDDPIRLYSLGTALAQIYRGALPEPPKWLRWATETTSEVQIDEKRADSTPMAITNALVNYSKLETIKLSTLPSISPTCVAEAGRLFRNRVVIVGNATNAIDTYIVHGREEPIPGVYLHACAAYTLIKEPLYELNCSVRLAVDFVISVIIILSVAWFRLRHSKQEGLAWHQRQAKYTYLAAAFVLVAGILLVRFLGVMWLDFVPLIIALLLHPVVERRIDNFLERRDRDGTSSAAPLEEEP